MQFLSPALRWTARAAVLLALGLFIGRWLADPGKARMFDFSSFYMAAQAASQGADIYDTAALNESAAGQGLRVYVFPYVYPPFLAFVLQPLGNLAIDAARLVWLCINLAAIPLIVLLAGLTATKRAAAGSPGGDLALLLSAALVFVLPFYDNIDMGQVNLLVLLFLSLSLFLFSRERDWASGAMLGVAVMIKVSPAVLLLYFLVRGRIKVVLGSLASVATLAAASLLLGAGGAWGRFFATLPEMSHATAKRGMLPPGSYPNFALAGLMSRIFPEDLPVARISTQVLLALLAAGLAYGVWRMRSERARDLMVLPFLVLMVVSSPFAYLHHVAYLLPGAALALTWALLGVRSPVVSPMRRMAWFLALLAPLALASVQFPDRYGRWDLSPLAAKYLTSLNLYALLLLMAVGLALARREREEQEGAGARFTAPSRLATAGSQERPE